MHSNAAPSPFPSAKASPNVVCSPSLLLGITPAASSIASPGSPPSFAGGIGPPTVATPSAQLPQPQHDPMQDSINRYPGSINIFVAGLTQVIGDREFENLFSRFGPILSAKVMLDVNTGLSRGFGFLLFKNEEDGLRAKSEMDGASLGPNTIHVSISEHDGYVVECKTVYIRNFPLEISEQRIVQVFRESCGPIVRCTVSRDHSSNPNTQNRYNLASIEFVTLEAARAAVKFAHGNRPFEECTISLLAKFAESVQSRELRRKRRTGREGQFSLPPPPAYASSSASPIYMPSLAQPSAPVFCFVPTSGVSGAMPFIVPSSQTPPAFVLLNPVPMSGQPGSPFVNADVAHLQSTLHPHPSAPSSQSAPSPYLPPPSPI